MGCLAQPCAVPQTSLARARPSGPCPSALPRHSSVSCVCATPLPATSASFEPVDCRPLRAVGPHRSGISVLGVHSAASSSSSPFGFSPHGPLRQASASTALHSGPSLVALDEAQHEVAAGTRPPFPDSALPPAVPLPSSHAAPITASGQGQAQEQKPMPPSAPASPPHAPLPPGNATTAEEVTSQTGREDDSKSTGREEEQAEQEEEGGAEKAQPEAAVRQARRKAQGSDGASNGARREVEGEDVAEAGLGVLSREEVAREVQRRRNFAIISHPDAGKTTLTEKLLLYGGAIHEAGSVKARRTARHATSDWMELEKQRGISITSTAMVFETQGTHITLLDTPGHQDFGEDTYRTLAAADNAVMLVDSGKGLEPQTRKLFEVCRMRRLPIFTFMNKMDRPSLEPLQLLDEIEKEFGLATWPVNWPIGSGDRFQGLYDRVRREVHLFARDDSHGSRAAQSTVLAWDNPSLEGVIEGELLAQAREEIELLDELVPPLDLARVHRGELSPVFFGSAMNNFGVRLFLQSFLEYALQPGQHDSTLGPVSPDDPFFSGFVFKLQANMDPKHRDKVAFVRVCSGQFRKGMKVQLARTGKSIALTRPQKLFAQERTVVEDGFAGDVIGLNNPNAFAIGDTIYTGPRREFPPIPSFSPELFSYLRNPNPSKYKQFHKGISELLGEGAVQVLYSLESSRQDPILAAVGQLQFEVVQHRMQSEYGVETGLEPLGFTVARWVSGGWDALNKAGRLYVCTPVKDQWGRPVLLFRNDWNVNQLLSDHPEIGELAPYALPPSAASLDSN